MDLIFDVLRSAKGGFKRFHQRLHRIAAGPVLREAAANGDPKVGKMPKRGWFEKSRPDFSKHFLLKLLAENVK